LPEPDHPLDTLLSSYTGNSMHPTLDKADLLEVVPNAGGHVAAGDVVFFVPPGENQPVVHRVVRATSQGIRTRGDHNPHDDDWLLQPARITGRVVAAWRGQRRRTIAGGRRGQLWGYLLRWQPALNRIITRLARAPYRALSRWGGVASLLPASWQPRPVVFQVNGCGQVRLLLGRRVIGYYDFLQQRWVIRRPYRLLVNEVALSPFLGNCGVVE